MAILNANQLQEILATPKTENQLAECIRHHERLRLHTEVADSKRRASPAVHEFMDWVRRILPAKKYERFEQLMRWPLPTTKVTKKIFADLKRVFDGKNRIIRHQFASRELEDDFERFKAKVFLDNEFWQEDVWTAIKNGINNFIVVDILPQEEGGMPRPTAFIVRAEDILKVDVNKDNKVEWIAYKVGVDTIVIIDEMAYRTFKLIENEWKLTVEAFHELGETPAKSIWSDYMHENKFVEKVGPISAILDELDEIVFWQVANRYYQMYGAFPIYWEFATECTYEDEAGNPCEGGYINFELPGMNYAEGEEMTTDEPQRRQKPCPKCEANKSIGPGTNVQVPAPMNKEDFNLREPMGFITVDKAALEFGEEKQAQRIQSAIYAAVGIAQDMQQAINPDQQSALFEDKKSILYGVKHNLEIIHHWTLDIMARLRYDEQYYSTEVNYGDEFYLRSEAELIKQYADSRAAGMPSYLLQANRQLLGQTRFRTDSEQLKRSEILADLEPYPDNTVAELLAFKAQSPDSVDPIAFVLKLRFSEFVARFEREQLSILHFGENIDYGVKIQKIFTVLYNYATEDYTSNQKKADDEAKKQNERQPKQEPAKGGDSKGSRGANRTNNQ